MIHGIHANRGLRPEGRACRSIARLPPLFIGEAPKRSRGAKT